MNAPALPEVVSGKFLLGMPEEEYHSHPALSASGMKNLLRSPKHFRAARALNKAKAEFDTGHAVHAKVLGVGAPIVEIPSRLLSADGGIRSNDAKEWVENARSAGEVPLKPVVYASVMRAVEAILANPKARALLEVPGWTEASLFGEDPLTGVKQRGRIDRLADQLVDLKTTTDVRKQKLRSAISDFHYDLSAAVYRALVEIVLGADPGPMHLIFAEKEPPHEVAVVVLSHPDWVEGGRRKMRAALDLYARCVEFGHWPGADDDEGPITELEPPAWYLPAVDRLETDL